MNIEQTLQIDYTLWSCISERKVLTKIRFEYEKYLVSVIGLLNLQAGAKVFTNSISDRHKSASDVPQKCVLDNNDDNMSASRLRNSDEISINLKHH